ncbi:uncharacterized protein LOC143764855 [Ranitomeya variabilis]|uniref:uncharacterized protein LOC143764855 n=1 Tax=Ranitomeya variabilis TaxID=490064 RepID=UPI00405673DC
MMDGVRKDNTEMILKFTLKIIYLLTGENYGPLKQSSKQMKALWKPHISSGWSGSQSPMEPSPHSLTEEKNNDQKILELANKIIELLTGEITVRCQDVTVYFSMEEWEYIEGHKDLYKDFIGIPQPIKSPSTETDGFSKKNLQKSTNSKDASQLSQDHPKGQAKVSSENKVILNSTPVGSHKGNPSEKCFSSKDCPKIPCHTPQINQVEDLKMIKVEVLDNEEELYGRSNLDCEQEELCLDGSIKRSLPKNCCSPLYSPDSPAKYDSDNPQGEDQIDIQVCIVGGDEETYMSGDQYLMEDDTSTDDSPSKKQSRKKSKRRLGAYSHCGAEEVNSRGSFFEANPIAPNIHSIPHDFGLSYDTTIHGSFAFDPSCIPHNSGHLDNTIYSGFYPHNNFSFASNPVVKSFPCPECGKPFRYKWHLNKHLRIHRGDKPYMCYECGLCFKEKFNLANHLKIHTGDKPYLCSQCGKRFSTKSNLLEHLRVHSGEKPFPCSECGKCFKNKSHLVEHHRIHTGEKPFPCSECGKGFTSKSRLLKHVRVHTGEKPFCCPECNRSFNQKAHLIRHQKSHNHL